MMQKDSSSFFHNLLNRFCKLHGFSLTVDFNPTMKSWICKIILIEDDSKHIHDGMLIDQRFGGINVWSEYRDTVEDACKNYVDKMLGRCLAFNLDVLLDRSKRKEAIASRKMIAVPKTLEELIMKLDLEET